MHMCRAGVVSSLCLALAGGRRKHVYWIDFVHLPLSPPNFSHEVIIPKYRLCQRPQHPLPALSHTFPPYSGLELTSQPSLIHEVITLYWSGFERHLKDVCTLEFYS